MHYFNWKQPHWPDAWTLPQARFFLCSKKSASTIPTFSRRWELYFTALMCSFSLGRETLRLGLANFHHKAHSKERYRAIDNSVLYFVWSGCFFLAAFDDESIKRKEEADAAAAQIDARVIGVLRHKITSSFMTSLLCFKIFFSACSCRTSVTAAERIKGWTEHHAIGSALDKTAVSGLLANGVAYEDTVCVLALLAASWRFIPSAGLVTNFHPVLLWETAFFIVHCTQCSQNFQLVWPKLLTPVSDSFCWDKSALERPHTIP